MSIQLGVGVSTIAGWVKDKNKLIMDRDNVNKPKTTKRLKLSPYDAI